MKNILVVHKLKKIILLLIAALIFGYATKSIFAQTNLAISITSTAYPLSLPTGGGRVTFAHTIKNLDGTSLNDVVVADDKCIAMSGELGDTNGNHLLDPGEVWIYTCTTMLAKTTTDIATVTAYANGLKTIDTDTITVAVATATAPGFPNGGSSSGVPGLLNNGPNPGLPNNGTNPNNPNITVIIWGILGGILMVLIIVFFLIRKMK